MRSEIIGDGFIPSPYSCTFHDESAKDKSGRCKPCRNAVERERHKRNKDERTEFDTVCGVCGGPKITGLHCEKCKKEAKKRYHYKHKDELNSKCREWWDENKDDHNAKRRQIRKENPGKFREQGRKNYVKHKHTYYESNKRRRLANPEYNRAAFHKIRAKRRAAPGSFTADDLKVT